MDVHRVDGLSIALSEAVTNAVVAHQRTDSEAQIKVLFGVADVQMFEVIVQDSGSGFVPRTAAECDAGVAHDDWRVEGGLGVTLMRSLADEVEFAYDSGTLDRIYGSLD